MIETIFSPPFAAGFAQVMTYVMLALMTLAAIQGVRDRVKQQRK